MRGRRRFRALSWGETRRAARVVQSACGTEGARLVGLGMDAGRAWAAGWTDMDATAARQAVIRPSAPPCGLVPRRAGERTPPGPETSPYERLVVVVSPRCKADSDSSSSEARGSPSCAPLT